MDRMKVYDSLLGEIGRMPVIDTHEHLPWDEKYRCEGEGDVLREYLSHYMSSDVVSAGLSREDLEKVIGSERSVADRWRIVEPYWEAARYTGYGRALDIAVKGIYGIEGVNRDTVEALSDAFRAARRPGHFRHVLRELCNIETCLVDVWRQRLDGESELFRRIWQPLGFICPAPSEFGSILSDIEKNHGIRVNSLDDWQAALEAELDWILARYGVRVLKCAIAYMRTLRFEEVGYPEAKALFQNMLAQRAGDGIPPAFPRALEDYMMHFLLGLANRRNLTIQFHTGLLEGNGNTLSNSDPSLLNNLFLKYPDVDFDLFHISYPYQGVACALAKMFPNVTIDMCWAHIISPSACVAALDDFLDAVPYNKISGFGGDYLFADGVYGHLMLSRENIARTLAGKVERGVFGEERAVGIAKALYYDNPRRIFKLHAMENGGRSSVG